MKVLLNGEIYTEAAMLPINNRGFQFGDGLFETMIINDGTIRFYDDHFSRLKNGMKAIGLSISSLDKQQLHDEILQLTSTNELSKCRAKVAVWRKVGSSVGYNVDTDQFDYSVVTKSTGAPMVQSFDKLSICDKVELTHSITSNYKTLSALPYVIAAQEKKRKQKDDLVLTDSKKNVSECTSSNIFWIANNQLCTPPLDTGCINGIMRTQIMNAFEVFESHISYSELTKKESIFSTNVARLSVFTSIDDHMLEKDHPIITEVKRLWEL